MGEIATPNTDIREHQQSSNVERLLSEIMSRRPGLKEWWDRHQNMTLTEYSQSLLVNNAQALQPREDFAQAIAEQAVVLGSDRAAALAKQIVETPVVITANHHGPDYLGLTRQGVGILALATPKNREVVVIACGAVPQNNIAYARGILLSRTEDVGGREISTRVNITPDSQRDTLVSASAPMTEAMIKGDGKKAKGALGQVADLLTNGKITPQEAERLTALLNSDYMNVIHDQRATTLSQQSTLINDRLWKAEFSSELQTEIPNATYLELEKVIATVLKKDLQNPNSLAYQLIFNSSLRASLITNLDGVDSCWDTTKLARLTDSTVALDSDDRMRTMAGAGTMFFTGVDAKGRRVPLNLVGERMSELTGRRLIEQIPLQEASEDTPLFLRGTDKSGNPMSIAFTPEALTLALDKGEILPSVFMDFVTILSRGIRAHGGFNQGNYYPSIKNGIMEALSSNDKQDWANVIATVPTDNLTAGLMFAIAKYGEVLKPAGGVELLVHPITSNDYDKMGKLTVKEAFLFGAPAMYRVVCPEAERDETLLAITEQDVYNYIGGDKFVTANF